MTCCVTGHRPKGFPFPREDDGCLYMEYLDKLYRELQKLIREGYRNFITGMAEGADMDFANYVLYFRDIEENITLEAALPYPMQISKKSSPYLDQRDEVLMTCDSKHIVSPRYFRGCMQKRNRYMVDKSDIVLAIWNGKYQGGTWDTIKYARSKEKPIRYIMLNGNLLL